MATSSFVPKLQLHKATGQAFVRLHRSQKPIYLGKFGTPEAEAGYYRTIAEWRLGGVQPDVLTDELTIGELVVAFWKHARIYYRDAAGKPTAELPCLKAAIQPMLDLYQTLPCSQFGPKALKAVRQRMVDLGWSRKQVNKQIARIRLVFRWGTEEELVAAGIHEALRAVRGLQRGRSDAKERDPVGPAPMHLVEAIRPRVSDTIWDMVSLQLLCGGRPQDIVQLRPDYIDRSGDIWIATMPQHKTAWRGDVHRLFLGPQAQAVLAPYLLRRPAGAPVFSPRESADDRRAARTAARVTPPEQGNRPGTNVKSRPQRAPRDGFSVQAYGRAILRACDLAFPLPPELGRSVGAKTGLESVKAWRTRLGPEQWLRVERWMQDHRFSPNQLRHSAATALRAKYGIDVAQTFLGHKVGSSITEIYAEANIEQALRVARVAG